MLDYWRDRCDPDEPEQREKWQGVQLAIERYAAGLCGMSTLRRELSEVLHDEPELAELLCKLERLAASPKRAERLAARMR